MDIHVSLIVATGVTGVRWYSASGVDGGGTFLSGTAHSSIRISPVPLRLCCYEPQKGESRHVIRLTNPAVPSP